MKNFDYKGSYINKTNHHIYIAPSEELKDIIAHYTITFPSEVPASSNYFILFLMLVAVLFFRDALEEILGSNE
mgnify:FL=1